MKNYEFLVNDEELNNIIDSINRVNESTLFVCHGRYHATFVVNTIEKLLTDLGFDKHIVELGKIAGLLHDIGTINGKKGHVQRSSIMCVEFLNKTDLAQEDKEIIIHAIEDHSNGDNITSPVGAALLLADKLDISKNRMLELGKKDQLYRNSLNIEETTLKVDGENIIINYIVNDRFPKEVLLEDWKKVITVSIKASQYLVLPCIFQFNGSVIDLTWYNQKVL